MKDKEKLFHYRRASKVNIYDMGGFEDYYYGYMIPDTSYLGAFSLHLYEDGFVLQMPQRKDPKTVPAFEPENKMFRVRKESLKWGEMLEIPTVGLLNDYIVHHLHPPVCLPGLQNSYPPESDAVSVRVRKAGSKADEKRSSFRKKTDRRS